MTMGAMFQNIGQLLAKPEVQYGMAAAGQALSGPDPNAPGNKLGAFAQNMAQNKMMSRDMAAYRKALSDAMAQKNGLAQTSINGSTIGGGIPTSQATNEQIMTMIPDLPAQTAPAAPGGGGKSSPVAFPEFSPFIPAEMQHQIMSNVMAEQGFLNQIGEQNWEHGMKEKEFGLDSQYKNALIEDMKNRFGEEMYKLGYANYLEQGNQATQHKNRLSEIGAEQAFNKFGEASGIGIYDRSTGKIVQQAPPKTSPVKPTTPVQAEEQAVKSVAAFFPEAYPDGFADPATGALPKHLNMTMLRPEHQATGWDWAQFYSQRDPKHWNGFLNQTIQKRAKERQTTKPVSNAKSNKPTNQPTPAPAPTPSQQAMNKLNMLD